MRGNVLVTGGAGFVGCNLVDSLLCDGHRVKVFDALSRPGSEFNLEWLRTRHPTVKFVRGDVRDGEAVREAAHDVDVIYHFAAQVAVTSSVVDPRTDFDVNALGTLNVLEAARLSQRRPIVLFTSTNKVYGGLDDVAVAEHNGRYHFEQLREGVSESQPLDFHSPYGCSKGTGDQYVRDYARIYGLRTVVFRMSCIYGPRQFGNEDQGWVAHFVIAAATGNSVNIYGDGKQVRDVLFVEDLVRAMRLAVDKIETTAGNVYNIGGGPRNALSVWHEFGPMLERLAGRAIPASFGDWRPGDQKCYVSDIRRAEHDLGWKPVVNVEAGVKRLWEWASLNAVEFKALREAPASGVTEGAFA